MHQPSCCLKYNKYSSCIASRQTRHAQFAYMLPSVPLRLSHPGCREPIHIQKYFTKKKLFPTDLPYFFRPMLPEIQHLFCSALYTRSWSSIYMSSLDLRKFNVLASITVDGKEFHCSTTLWENEYFLLFDLHCCLCNYSACPLVARYSFFASSGPLPSSQSPFRINIS